MTEFEITDNAYITLEYGQQLSIKPRILLDCLQVLITASQSTAAMDKEMSEVIGSTEDWLHLTSTDSLGFDPSTRLLKIVALYYPEDNKVPDNLQLLQEAEKIAGLPRLREHSGLFALEPFPYRYYHMEGNLLLCFNETFTLAGRLQEVVVSNDLSLFFRNNRYCAWGLYHPEIRLTDRIAAETDHLSNDFLKASLRDAFDLIKDETVNKMSKHDPDSLQQIAALYNRIAVYTAPNRPLTVLKEWLFELADKFYPKKMVSGLFEGKT
ncbi:hypothetical protein HB364_17125 [Pseudoflavitalea sp. X16]|uniref:hypothetical protein n=1 Tax=Paraflavitalea devenefica TaxID=2716334 RepID=UPI00141E0FE7|nr:hypothetical protein [Paraflavitalea devenefica]NII26815.1 hypothetical protein [Paraflavitalea devenefica]